MSYSIAKMDIKTEPKLTPKIKQGFAPVVPIPIAKRLKDEHLLGKYHLLLAHDVVDKSVEYYSVYNKPENFIIMDNSVIELGDAVDNKMLAEACEIVGANVLALPDVLMDSEATFKSTIDALSSWDLPNDLELMAIPQGDSIHSWGVCLYDIIEISQDLGKPIKWIGVPKNIREKLGVSRQGALQRIKYCMHDTDHEIKVHMLGFSDDYLDDLTSTLGYADIVTGIDSAAPIWMGLRGIPLESSVETYARVSRGNFWEDPYGQGRDMAQAIRNIKKIRKFLDIED